MIRALRQLRRWHLRYGTWSGPILDLSRGPDPDCLGCAGAGGHGVMVGSDETGWDGDWQSCSCSGPSYRLRLLPLWFLRRCGVFDEPPF
jgi:hypothetical protein